MDLRPDPIRGLPMPDTSGGVLYYLSVKDPMGWAPIMQEGRLLCWFYRGSSTPLGLSRRNDGLGNRLKNRLANLLQRLLSLS